MDDLATLLHACRQEREDFLKRGETSSPACVELFRRAFAGEEAAWDAILRQIFQPEIRRWVEAAARVRNLSADDVEEAI
jgi:DNA-binding TFAR19-related protein (PDSD5 family)